MPAPVISVAEMREWERAAWTSGRTENDVISRVGLAVARRAARMVRGGDLVLILAGKGHNGDDARKAREHLPDWRVYLRNISNPVEGISEILSLLGQRPALIVDGLFGIGLNRPLDGEWAELIRRINELETQVLAVDVPSGLNADTGLPEGAAVKASVTLTLGAPKKGLLLPPAWPHVGRLEVEADIGLTPCPHSSETNWILPGDFAEFPPPRETTAHKGDFGRLAIVAGSLGYHGAAVLASRGAQRAQPGLTTLYTSAAVYKPVASQLQAVMVDLWKPNLNLGGKCNGILIGPGLTGEHLPEVLRTATRYLWQTAPGAVVVDAGGLDWLDAADAVPENAIRVVTPHAGEAARLLHATSEQVQADRPNALREISRRLGNCWVVLKGHQTLIGRSTGGILVNSSGNPHLAQGGSGDVLSGFLAGLLAQPALQADPLQAIAYGVWQHGAAADRLSETSKNWVVEDLAREIGRRPEPATEGQAEAGS